MRTVVHYVIVSACSLPLILAGSRAAAQAPPVVPPPTTTLWNFLGIPQTINKMKDVTLNKSGKHPNIERKPPLKRIGDPENLFSKNPAIKTAAEIKQEEDLKQQKIKAIRYLATIGCGCYPGVKEALLAALDDCTEEVRYEAALALAQAAGNQCRACGQTCCDQEVRAKLADVAFGMTPDGCPKEASRRVREAAQMALNRCGGPPVTAEPVQVPREVPLPPPAAPGVELPQPLPPAPLQGLRRGTTPGPRTMSVFNSEYDRRLAAPSTAAETPAAAPQRLAEAPKAAPIVAEVQPVVPVIAETQPALPIVAEAQPAVPALSPTAPVDEESVLVMAEETQSIPALPVEHREAAEVEAHVTTISHATTNASPTVEVSNASKELLDGRIAAVDAAAGAVEIRLSAGRTAHAGKRARVFHQQGARQVRAGELEIVDVVGDTVLARPIGDFDLNQIAAGDVIFLYSVGPSADRVATR